MAGKNLGTLTIDLVAKVGGFVQGMDKAERSSSKWRKQVEKDAKMVGTAVGAAAAAVVAGLSAMTVATVRQAAEISKFAALSGTANESFQRYAAGAKALGIEQEKLADIFKDTQDKVGDFLQTGGGALKDFFDNVAPKVGVTAEQFRKLSGPEALGLYVSSLEKAGASQSEMVFYLEAIASDATLLLPLLRNNSEGFRQLGDAAAAAGAIMDDSLIRSSMELQAATVLADQAFAGMRNQIMQGMMPVLSDLADELFGVATNTGIAEEAGETFGVILKGAAAIGMSAYAAFQLVGKSLAALAAGFAAAEIESSDFLLGPLGVAKKLYDNQEKVRAALTIGFDDVAKSAEEYGKVIEGIMSAGEEGAKKTGSRVQDLADLLEQSRKLSQKSGIEVEATEDKKKKAAKKARDAVVEQISAIERAAKVWGMTADEVQIYDLRLKGASETQIKYAEGLLKSVDAMEKQKKLQEDYAGVVDSLRTEEEKRTITLREQLGIIEAMGDADPTNKSRAIDAAFADAPDFSGLDPSVGGIGGEISKIKESEIELESWYSAQLEMLETYRKERADLNADWDEQEAIIKQEHENRLAAIEKARQQTTLSVASEIFGNLATLTQSENKKLVAIGKAAAIAQATISGFTAIQNALAVPPYPLGLALAVTAGVATAANIASIAGVGFRAGGYTGGAGVNDVAGVVHGQEYVFDAEATKRIGVANLEAIRAGRSTANSGGVAFAEVSGATSTERYNGRRDGVSVTQNITTQGRIDRRTSNQLATDSARKTRIAQSRLA